MKTRRLVLAFGAVALMATSVLAQPERGRPPGDGPPSGRQAGSNTVLAALDPDGDQELSASEIKNAVDALSRLDKNGDGKLDRTELRMQRAGGGARQRDGQGRPGGPPSGRGPGAGPPGEGPPGGGPPGRNALGDIPGDAESSKKAATDFVERMRGFDKNDDGKVDASELPERMRTLFDKHDTNSDGSVDSKELDDVIAKAATFRGPRGGRSGAPGAGRGGPPGGPGEGPPRGGPPGGGPPSPERFIEHAMTFDADGDGKLSADELKKFAEEMPPPPPLGEHGGPGGPRPGGPPRGGPPSGEDEGNGRPQRPRRAGSGG